MHKANYIDLYFGDASHFGLTPNVPYAWQQKDQPILLPAKKGKSFSVFGLMTTNCKLFAQTYEGTLNPQTVVDLLDKFANTIVKKTIVVLDNAPIHKSKLFMINVSDRSTPSINIQYCFLSLRSKRRLWYIGH